MSEGGESEQHLRTSEPHPRGVQRNLRIVRFQDIREHPRVPCICLLACLLVCLCESLSAMQSRCGCARSLAFSKEKRMAMSHRIFSLCLPPTRSACANRPLQVHSTALPLWSHFQFIIILLLL